jgi:hypothetical protein
VAMPSLVVGTSTGDVFAVPLRAPTVGVAHAADLVKLKSPKKVVAVFMLDEHDAPWVPPTADYGSNEHAKHATSAADVSGGAAAAAGVSVANPKTNSAGVAAPQRPVPPTQAAGGVAAVAATAQSDQSKMFEQLGHTLATCPSVAALKVIKHFGVFFWLCCRFVSVIFHSAHPHPPPPTHT